MPRRPPPPVVRTETPSPLLQELARRFEVAEWCESYSVCSFTVGIAASGYAPPNIQIEALRLTNGGEAAAVASRLRELADIIERCGRATRADPPVVPADDEHSDDDEPPAVRGSWTASLDLAALPELPKGCRWEIAPDEEAHEELVLFMLDGRTGKEHVGDGVIRDWGELFSWEMTGKDHGHSEPADTPEDAARSLVRYLAELAAKPESPPRRGPGRPRGSKNRPRNPPPVEPPPAAEAPSPPDPPPAPAEREPELPFAPEPVPPEPPRTPGQRLLEVFERAGGSLDPRGLPELDAEALGEAVAKGWIRALPPLADGTVVCWRLTDTGWAELEGFAARGAP